MHYFKVFVYFLASITWSSVLCKDKPRTRFKPDKDRPSSEQHSVYIRGVQCNASDKYVYPNFSCFAKSWSRTVSTVNVIVTTRMPLIEIHFEAQCFYRYGNIYREVIHAPRVEWCGMAKDYLLPKIPTPLSVVIQTASDMAPEAIHQCPYTGLNIRNATFKSNALKSVFPSGQYRVSVSVYAANNESIGVVNIFAEVNSPLKETFGKK